MREKDRKGKSSQVEAQASPHGGTSCIEAQVGRGCGLERKLVEAEEVTTRMR